MHPVLPHDPWPLTDLQAAARYLVPADGHGPGGLPSLVDGQVPENGAPQHGGVRMPPQRATVAISLQ